MPDQSAGGGTGPGETVGDPAAAMLGALPAAAVAEAAAQLLGCEAEDVSVEEPQRLSGGASRLTFLVEVGGPGSSVRLIVQKERSGSAGANLPMSTQVELLRLARAHGVPVPDVLASGGEPGSGFVVLEWLPGESVVRRIMRDDTLRGARSTLAFEVGRAVASVHGIDPSEVPRLPSADPVESMRGLLDMLGEPHPAFEVGLVWLDANRPPPRPDVVTHGDFRMGNLLVAPEGITAVLDWELAHVGSPIEDLGWFCGRAWRFGSPLRAGGVGSAEELCAGYEAGGGIPPGPEELDWWEAYGTLRWGLICVLQASVHLSGMHRSVELAAIGRRAAECEEDLLALILGDSDYEPPALEDADGPGTLPVHDAPTTAELLEAVSESLGTMRKQLEGSAAFEARVSGNVVDMVRREVLLATETASRRRSRLDGIGVADSGELAAMIRDSSWDSLDPAVHDVIRADVRDKLAVSNPAYWRGDG